MDVIIPNKSFSLVSSTVPEDDFPVWNSGTSYQVGDEVISLTTHKAYRSLRGKASTITISIADPGVVSWTAHGLGPNDAVVLTTTGALPTGYTAGATYYPVNVGANSFGLAQLPGGPAIVTSGGQSGTHTATVSTNQNKNPADEATNNIEWVEIGPTNRWKPFDKEMNTVATQDTSAEWVFTAGIVNAIGLFNVTGAELEIEITVGGNIVYTKLIPLIQQTSISWSTYFFSPIVPISAITLVDLPPYNNAQIRITLTGSTVGLGGVIPGQKRYVGRLQYGAQGNRVSYSRIETDEFGVTTIIKRKSVRNVRGQLKVMTEEIPSVEQTIEDARDIPCVYIGADSRYPNLVTFGIWRDFTSVVEYQKVTVYNFEAQGI